MKIGVIQVVRARIRPGTIFSAGVDQFEGRPVGKGIELPSLKPVPGKGSTANINHRDGCPTLRFQGWGFGIHVRAGSVTASLQNPDSPKASTLYHSCTLVSLTPP